MRRRHLPRLDYDYVKISERVHILERIVQAIGFTPDFPYTLNVNDGTRNRVLIGKINGDYGIKIVNGAGATIIFADGHITADGITTGTLDADIVNVINLTADNIITGTLKADFISGGTFDCSTMSVIHLSASSIDTGSMHGDYIQAGTLDANRIKAHDIVADQLSVTTLITQSIQIGNNIVQNTHISNLSATKINTGTLDADIVNVININASNINIGGMSAQRITSGCMSGNRIYGGSGFFNTLMVNGSAGHTFYVHGDAGVGADLHLGDDLYVNDKLEVGGNVDFDGDWLDICEHVQCGQGNINFEDNCTMNQLWVDGNLSCGGDFHAGGSKSFKIPHPLKGDRWLVYSAVESNGVFLDIHGQAEIIANRARVEFPDYHQAVTSGEPSIQLTKVGWFGDLCIGKADKSGFIILTNGAQDGSKVNWFARIRRGGFEGREVEPKMTEEDKNSRHFYQGIVRNKILYDDKLVSKAERKIAERKAWVEREKELVRKRRETKGQLLRERKREKEQELVVELVKLGKRNKLDNFKRAEFTELNSNEVESLRREANDNLLSKG